MSGATASVADGSVETKDVRRNRNNSGKTDKEETLSPELDVCCKFIFIYLFLALTMRISFKVLMG